MYKTDSRVTEPASVYPSLTSAVIMGGGSGVNAELPFWGAWKRGGFITPGEGAASEKLKPAPLTDALLSGRDSGCWDSR